MFKKIFDELIRYLRLADVTLRFSDGLAII
jgi:hypothetical protein